MRVFVFFQSRTKAKAGSPSVKYERHSLVMEPYPIRSRLAGAHVAVSFVRFYIFF